MKNSIIKGNILAARIIPQVNREVAKKLNLRDDQKSLLIYSGDADDIAYISSDYATKMCNVEVIHGESMFAGAANANTKFAGDVIIALAGPNPSEMKNAYMYIEQMHRGNDVHFVSCTDDDSVIYLSYCIARTGSYLSKLNGINKGDSLAYCVAPPMEGMYAMDVAAKAADVRMVNFFSPPTNTNFCGSMFTGTESACRAACQAYATAVQSIVDNPIKVL